MPHPPRAEAGRPARPALAAASAGIALAVAAVAAIAPSLGGGFVFDDHAIVEGGPLVVGPLSRIWLSTDPVDYWPLTYSSFWLEWRAWGANPLGYRLVNVALHAACAILLWRVLRRLRVPGAWLAGLLFAVHPVTVESVAWISERKNVLSGALALGTLLLWLRYRDEGGRGRYGAAVGLFLLALLAKTSVVTIPVAMLLAVLWRKGRLERRDALEVAPFLALALALGAVTVWFQHVRSLAGADYGRGLAERVGGAAWALVHYLRTAFVPVGVPLVAPRWPVSPASPLFWAPLAALLVGAAILWAGRRGPLRPVGVALAYQAVTVAPVLGLLDMAYLRIAPVAGHLQYLALLGPVALVAAGLTRFAERQRRVALALAGLVVVGLAALAASRAAAFRDDLAYWDTAVHGAPQALFPALRLADELAARRRVPEARAALADAAERLRDPADRLRAQAILLVHSRRLDEGLAAASAAEALRPDPFFQLDLGQLLIQAREPARAVPLLEHAVQQNPRSAEHRYWLGSALALTGRLPQAAEVLRPACGASRGHFGTCTALVVVLARMGQVQRARAELAAALGVAPGDGAVDRLLAESGVPGAR